MTAASDFDLSAHSQLLRHEVEEALARYARYDADCPEQLAAAIRHSLLAPCKRLRPLLVLMAAEACGYDLAAALPAACAVEMIHTYSLIHDDLPAMDDDDMRRGRPSCHAKFGEATAILAGDALLAQAFEVLARDVTSPDIAARCCGELAKAAGASNLVGGQEDDLRNEFAGGGTEDLERIHRRKTGAMIRVSLRLGGIIGRGSPEQITALDAYGERLGLAFQIVDDLLDLRGDTSTMGKKTGKDSSRGKLTFPALLGEAESRRRAEDLINSACSSLAPFGKQREPLESLARYVLERNH
ncbi:MAG: polyprenyl synthetase family protein [Pirellulaceae bacterium]|nr:polyprenyl synthetase family protein [Pirellulaceae bacterium]